MRLVEWPGHAGTFLTSKAGKLQKLTIGNLGGGTPSLTYTDMGLANFNVNSFGLDSTGSVIFWPACSEDNAGYTYDASGKGTARKWTEVHQIMGSRLRNGTFSDPFVYGEVTHDMHVMQVIDYLSSSTLTILSVDMKDALKGKADLWFTSIPLVKCANVIGCEAASSFAYPGEKALFYLTVRNDGNTYLSGFTAKLSEQGKTAIGPAKLEFSKATLCESGYNPADGGSLKNIEPDYALAPGKTSVYQVEITIPNDWKDEKKVSVSAAAAVAARAGGVKTQADGDVADEDIEEYVVGTGDLGDQDYDEELDTGKGKVPFDILHVWYDDSYDDDAEEDYADAPMESDEDGPHEKGPSIKPTPVKPSPASPSSSRTTPSTGDFAFPFGLAAAAAAAAGVGMAAYSKRRSELEEGKLAGEHEGE